MKLLSALMTKYSERRLTKMFPALKQAFQITSHLTMQERSQLYLLTKDCDTVLEIGSYVGASACCFGASMKSRGAGVIYCIDTWDNDAMTEGNRDTYTTFLKNTDFFAQFIIPVRGFSADVVNQITIKTNYVDMLFIDGDHSYDGVKADWNAYQRFLKAGSIVVFHDWGWAEGVKRVIMEDAISLVSNFNSLPNMWWGTIKA
jgi:predicted O-methyltransferase YrrM